MRTAILVAAVSAGLVLAACTGSGGAGDDSTTTAPPVSPTPTVTGTVRIALMDMTPAQNYLGFEGGLYAGGNVMPAAHEADGIARAQSIQPLDANGNPSASGKIVMISVGMSNTTQEFCSPGNPPPCNPWTFMGQAAADSNVNSSTLVVVDGARGGQTAMTWAVATSTNYAITQTRLTGAGVTEKQVQIAWVKQADANPTVSLPASNADAYVLEGLLASDVRAMKTRYPNLKMVFLSSRIYGGYATSNLNPEPYAYEGGFAVKWLIQAQVDQMASGAVVDTIAGDLDDGTVAPWLAWGPYLWADGTNARSDGLTWVQSDFETQDGTHPAQSAEQKVGGMLLSFFEGSGFTKCWFVNGGTCP